MMWQSNGISFSYVRESAMERRYNLTTDHEKSCINWHAPEEYIILSTDERINKE